MSVDIKTTIKTWNDVPDAHRQQLSALIQEVQTEMLQHFEVSHEWDDENDNGYFPKIDIEVHDVDDPDESSRRLVITSKPVEYKKLLQELVSALKANTVDIENVPMVSLQYIACELEEAVQALDQKD